MGQRLCPPGWSVPYDGGGVTPVPPEPTPLVITPNFSFPLTTSDLVGKTMSSTVALTEDDLKNNLVFHTTGRDMVVKSYNGALRLRDVMGYYNLVTLSEDGKTITFGASLLLGNDPITGFTYGA